MRIIKNLVEHRRRVITTSCFVLSTIIIFSVFYFTTLTGWRVDTADYKLIVKTSGYVNNLTITDWIRYFNASSADSTIPQGIRVETRPDANSNWSRVEIVFEDWKDEMAVIVLSNIRPLSNIPISNIPVDDSSMTFNYWGSHWPEIEGDSQGNCTNFFFHLSVSANTQIGGINVYSYSTEAIVEDGKLKRTDWPQSKEKTFTVSVWAFIFLSAAISSISITLFSVWRKNKSIPIFPIVTFLAASAMCFIYLFIGVGNDFLANSNANHQSRLFSSLLSPFFHGYYGHLMGNLLFSFLLGGSLIEIWLPKFYGLKRYFWYFSPLPLSILMSTLGLIGSGFLSVSVGASYWCIGIAIILLLSILPKRSQLFKENSSIWDFLALLLVGYLLFSAIWNYIASFLISYYSETTRSLAWGHLWFAALYSFLAVLTIVCGRKRDETSSNLQYQE